MKNKLFYLFIIISISMAMQAQSVSPVCPDFTNLSASYVTATTGNTGNPFATTGIVNGRHTLITTQGTDPKTGGALQLLPPGESSVIKLGNEQVGAQAEALSYRFIVDGNYPVLLLKFAVVLEDPGHSIVQQPRFVVRITDSNGNLLEDCAEYDVSAGANIPGFQTYNDNYYSPTRWRDWTNVGLDMSQFIGNEVQVQFITYDCSQSAHFGYAYFTASCISNILQLQNCGAGNYTLEAPDNFAAYLWDNGDQTRTSNRSSSETEQTITCKVTSATGCQFTLYGYVTTNSTPATSTSYKDTICEGETYSKHNFNLPPQMETGEKFYYNTYLNLSTCSSNITDELALMVIPRYNRIEASICLGEDYTENGFNIIQPAAGVRYDTLLVTINDNCNSYNCLKLTVNLSFNMPNLIHGDASPCTEEPVSYSFDGSETMTQYSWELPDNAVLIKGLYTSQVMIYFTDSTPVNITLKGKNGCGTGSASLAVRPNLTHNLYFFDNICAGSDYNQYGFHLEVHNSAGYYVYTKELTTVAGCDSTVTLAINVSPIPEVDITVKDSVLCNVGDTVSLFATDGIFTPSNLGNIAPNKTYVYDCNLNYLWNTGSTDGAITVNPVSTSTYSVTVTSSSGCFATASQTVVVDAPEPQVIYATICEGETYSDFGFNIGTQGIYNKIVSQDDCNVSVTLNLTVNSAYHTIIRDTVCNGVLYNNHGMEFTLYGEGLYTDTFHYLRTTGCDSTVTVEILVKPSPVTTLYDTVCQNQAYNKNGFELPVQTIAGEQTYTQQLSMSNGCDSTVVLNLTINPVYVNMISDEDTVGNHYQRYDFDLELSTDGLQTHTKHLQSMLTGCDSTVILNLNVIILPCVNDTVYIYDTICQNGSHFFKGENLNITGIYTDSLKNLNNCDSIVMLYLTVVDTLKYNINASICAGQIYTDNGFNADSTGTYYQYLTSIVTDCDSLVTLNLTVVDTLKHNINASICAGQIYTDNGFNADTTGIYMQSLTSYFGCDSIVTLYLTVYDTVKNNITANICAGQTYTDNGFNADTTGIYVQYLTSVVTQCDSIVTLYLTVNDSIMKNITANICSGETYTDYGFNANATGVYTQNLKTYIGCDSIVTLNLTVNQPQLTTINATICEGKKYTDNGFDVENERVYTNTHVSPNGCDNTVVLNLTVLKPEQTNITATICNNDIYNQYGFYTDEDGTHTITLNGSNGCDSIVTLNLNVLETYTTYYADTICEGFDYFDYGFELYSVTESDIITKTYTATNGCDSIQILDLTVIKPCIVIPNAFTPNEDGINDTWVIENLHLLSEFQVKVFNRWGQKLYECINDYKPWDGKYKGRYVPTGPYIYLVELKNKKYTGIVTVIL